MKKLLASLALCIPFYLIAQGFGIFGKDQPYFAEDEVSSGGGPQVDLTNIFGWWIAGSNTFQNVDGTDPATNGSLAKYWGDVSGNGYNLTNGSGGPMLVTNVIDGEPVMYFGTNAFPLLFGDTGGGQGYSQPYWIFIMAKRGTVTGVGQQNLITQNGVGNP